MVRQNWNRKIKRLLWIILIIGWQKFFTFYRWTRVNIESVLSVEIQVCKVNRIERNQTNLLTRELVSSASKITFLKIENTSYSLCMNYFAPIPKLFWLTIGSTKIDHKLNFTPYSTTKFLVRDRCKHKS